jgi:Protein of unknown function (DUF2934)
MSNPQKTTVHDQANGYPSVPQHRIRERAYEIYERRGRKGSHAEIDWLTAEAELKELKRKTAEMVAAVESLTGE